jgi:hypothetical protein
MADLLLSLLITIFIVASLPVAVRLLGGASLRCPDMLREFGRSLLLASCFAVVTGLTAWLVSSFGFWLGLCALAILCGTLLAARIRWHQLH